VGAEQPQGPPGDARFRLPLDTYQNCVQVIEAVNEGMAELEVEWTRDAKAVRTLEASYQRQYEDCLLVLSLREAEFASTVDHKVTAAEREALCHRAVLEAREEQAKDGKVEEANVNLRAAIDRGRAKTEAHVVRFKTLDRIGSGAQSALRAHTESSRFAGAAQ
jgi:hypothetical protein